MAPALSYYVASSFEFSSPDAQRLTLSISDRHSSRPVGPHSSFRVAAVGCDARRLATINKSSPAALARRRYICKSLQSTEGELREWYSASWVNVYYIAFFVPTLGRLRYGWTVRFSACSVCADSPHAGYVAFQLRDVIHPRLFYCYGNSSYPRLRSSGHWFFKPAHLPPVWRQRGVLKPRPGP